MSFPLGPGKDKKSVVSMLILIMWQWYSHWFVHGDLTPFWDRTCSSWALLFQHVLCVWGDNGQILSCMLLAFSLGQSLTLRKGWKFVMLWLGLHCLQYRKCSYIANVVKGLTSAVALLFLDHWTQCTVVCSWT